MIEEARMQEEMRVFLVGRAGRYTPSEEHPLRPAWTVPPGGKLEVYEARYVPLQREPPGWVGS